MLDADKTCSQETEKWFTLTGLLRIQYPDKIRSHIEWIRLLRFYKSEGKADYYEYTRAD